MPEAMSDSSQQGDHKVNVRNLVDRLSREISNAPSAAHRNTDGERSINNTLSATNDKGQLARARFSYSAKHEDELNLKVDEVIEVLGVAEEGWLKGSLHGKTGVFPANYVAPVIQNNNTTNTNNESVMVTNSPSNDSLNLSNNQNNPSPTEIIQPKKVKGVGFGAIPSGMVQLRKTQPKQTSTNNNDALSGAPQPKLSTTNIEFEYKPEPILVDNEPSKPAGTGHENAQSCAYTYVRVEHAYEGANEDELTLTVGDYLAVTNQHTDDAGWWQGLTYNGLKGMFPDNFVTIVPLEQVPKNRRIETSSISKTRVASGSADKDKAQVALAPPAVPSKPPPITALKPTNIQQTHGSNVNASRSLTPEPKASSSLPVTKASDTTGQSHSNTLPANQNRSTALSSALNKKKEGSDKPPVLPAAPSSPSVKPASARPVSSFLNRLAGRNTTNQRSTESVAECSSNTNTMTVTADTMEGADTKLTHLTQARVRPPTKRPPSALFLQKKRDSTDDLLELSPTIATHKTNEQTKGWARIVSVDASSKKSASPVVSVKESSTLPSVSAPPPNAAGDVPMNASLVTVNQASATTNSMVTRHEYEQLQRLFNSYKADTDKQLKAMQKRLDALENK